MPISQDYVKRPFFHSDFDKGLEDILFSEEVEQPRNVLDKLIFDKQKSLRSVARALFKEIRLREALNIHLLNKINKEICNVGNQISEIKLIGNINYSVTRSEDKHKIMNLKTQIQNLEREKRVEYLSCWRDLMILKKDFLNVMREYWELNRRQSMMAFKPTEK